MLRIAYIDLFADVFLSRTVAHRTAGVTGGGEVEESFSPLLPLFAPLFDKVLSPFLIKDNQPVERVPVAKTEYTNSETRRI
jgi:hypothetical protein